MRYYDSDDSETDTFNIDSEEEKSITNQLTKHLSFLENESESVTGNSSSPLSSVSLWITTSIA